ncbi:hypothetical protein FEM48_Zijuj06G0179500 [Ziziphus jujuba var. spinosa]|uniref:Uncharacterized protein n=1 Tax=Ziziphus jujuba var. spinosa TaxID=714518 RepID=A0A978VAS2_ZIZJJ|nr:hypothetical protein FEM48_Zijuj06G0179500 [Ziziphus jujuba var. spinosa]
MAENARTIPPKYDLDAKWDACLDLTVRRFVYASLGGAFGGITELGILEPSNSQPVEVFIKTLQGFDVIEIYIPSIMKLMPCILFTVRSPATRWASIAFGAGLGLGSAYTECSRLFDGSPAKFATPKITETPASQVDLSLLRMRFIGS